MSKVGKGARRGRLIVGVTGHRPNRMPEAEWPRLKAELARVMAALEAEHPNRKPTLFSGLAEGADRLAAFVALGRGWSLGAVLAFHRRRFMQDFPDAYAVGEFRALLRASQTIEEPTAAAGKGKVPEEGYHAVGQRLLALSQVLIAIWDGAGSRGKGGTVDVIADARARGIPVIWIHATKAQAARRLPPLKRTRAKRRVAAPRARRRRPVDGPGAAVA
jgi:hypothetical protein